MVREFDAGDAVDQEQQEQRPQQLAGDLPLFEKPRGGFARAAPQARIGEEDAPHAAHPLFGASPALISLRGSEIVQVFERAPEVVVAPIHDGQALPLPQNISGPEIAVHGHGGERPQPGRGIFRRGEQPAFARREFRQPGAAKSGRAADLVRQRAALRNGRLEQVEPGQNPVEVLAFVGQRPAGETGLDKQEAPIVQLRLKQEPRARSVGRRRVTTRRARRLRGGRCPRRVKCAAACRSWQG